jgi:DNA-binding NarL/FixJ family response regulator
VTAFRAIPHRIGAAAKEDEMLNSVLIVDDSKLARMAVAKALKAISPEWSIIEASSADEGLSILNRSGVDIALVDFNMPGRSGLDLLEDLRALHPTMPVAIITANSQGQVVQRARELNATHLSKPLNLANFKAFIEESIAALYANHHS